MQDTWLVTADGGVPLSACRWRSTSRRRSAGRRGRRPERGRRRALLLGSRDRASTARTTTTSGGFPSRTTCGCSRSSALEGFQAGLSWLTILRKREAFRRAFAGFDFRARRAVRAGATSSGCSATRRSSATAARSSRRSTTRAACVELVEAEGSLAAYVWRFEPRRASRVRRALTRAALRGDGARRAESRALAKELKRRGWTFVGPTTVYAFMQAMGLVNDHLEGCDARPRVEAARSSLTRPVT